MARQQYVAVLARFTGMFLFMSLCKSVCFICGRGERPRVFVSSELGSVWRDMRVPVCLSACFCGLNPRTVPHLSLNKFRALLGNRGLVLGLNVSYFFRSLGTPVEHVQSKLDQAEVADILRTSRSQKVAGSAGLSWTPVFVAVCFYFLGVAVNAT